MKNSLDQSSLAEKSGGHWAARMALMGLLSMGQMASGCTSHTQSIAPSRRQVNKAAPVRRPAPPQINSLKVKRSADVLQMIHQVRSRLNMARDLIRNDQIRHMNAIRKKLIAGGDLNQREVSQFAAEVYRYQLPEYNKIQNLITQKKLKPADRQFLISQVKLIFNEQKKILESHVRYLKQWLRKGFVLRSSQSIQGRIQAEIQDFQNIIQAIDQILKP